MTLKDQVRRGRGTDQERADRAEVAAFRPGIEHSNPSKNRTSQVLLVLAFFATIAGGSLALTGNLVGFLVFVVALPTTVAIGVWCFRHWDY